MIEQFIEKWGEEHRLLIEAAIKFLDENETGWNLDNPIDREQYIEAVIVLSSP